MNRHTSFIFDKNVYFFGGFSQKNTVPLGDMLMAPLNIIFENSDLKNILEKIDKNKAISNSAKIRMKIMKMI